MSETSIVSRTGTSIHSIKHPSAHIGYGAEYQIVRATSGAEALTAPGEFALAKSLAGLVRSRRTCLRLSSPISPRITNSPVST
jgi:hypothetical protein